MILQSLCDYYVRKQHSDQNSIPPLGYEESAISFVIVIEGDGRFINIEDWREGEGKRKRGKLLFVPQGGDRTGKDSWKTAFLLWDHPRYVFGIPKDGDDKSIPSKRLDSFRQRIHQVFPDAPIDAGVEAVVRFYADQSNIEAAKRHPLWREIKEGNGNVSFRINTATDLICQSPSVVDAVAREFGRRNEIGLGQCLVTGEISPIAKLHPATPVPGSQATAKLHSFNLESFGSYGKDKGANAPVSNKSTFEYTAALNHLLSSRDRPSKKQCLKVGDSWVVFWSDKPTELETNVVDIFGDPTEDDPDLNTHAVESLYKAIDNGLLENDEGRIKFFVLGLAPNVARIAIRYWHHGTVAELAARIQQHFIDLKIVHGDGEQEYLSLSAILASTANDAKFDSKKPSLVYYKGKYFDVKPNLGGELMRSILSDLPYPLTLLGAAVRRIHVAHEVTYPLAALIKAFINRDIRHSKRQPQEELKMALDQENHHAAYVLGRLFFALEEAQWIAHSSKTEPGINATIRDRFYGAASSTPITVFPSLLRLYPHHISKATKAGRQRIAEKLEKLVNEIIKKLPANNPFPPYMPIQDQGRFAVGYYHQRADFFTRADSNEGALS